MNSTDKPDQSPSHEGELEMRRRLPGPLRLDAQSLAKRVRPEISAALIEFIQRQPFFFIATASDQGDCDANFRGRNTSPAGRPQPLLIVKDPKTVLFPDFRGNGFYNSLGNILLNPHIGMLFIDFSEQQRARINGKAFVEDVMPPEAEIWPDAQAIVRVEVEQAYDNCSARIPKLKAFSGTTRMVQMKRRR